jgi:cobalt/nickel transport system ATP-binding protein
MPDNIFELKDVSFSYLKKFPALAGVDLRVERGAKVAVIGANGSGKSTLLQMLDGLIFPDKGRVFFFQDELNEARLNDEDFSRLFRKKVGFVFQNPDTQLFCPTVREDIAFGPLQLGVTPEATKKRLERLVDIFKIGPLLDRAPHQLSIGEKRKIAIISVLAIDPEVLLLDEPTAGLDPQTTRDIVDAILAAHEGGKTIISATHDLHIVEEIADTVHVFGPAKSILRSAAPAALLADAEFLKENNLAHIHRHRHQGVVHAHPHFHTEHHADGA